MDIMAGKEFHKRSRLTPFYFMTKTKVIYWTIQCKSLFWKMTFRHYGHETDE